MATFVKKENLTISIGTYEKNGQTKHEYRTIGELVTMRGDDGSEYQFGRLWGSSGVTDFKVYAQQNQQAAQQGIANAQQAAQPQQGFDNDAPF